jgi:chromosome segregation ATPase
MSTVAKILVVLNLGLAAAFLGSAANYLGYQETYRSQLNDEKLAHSSTKKSGEEALAREQNRVRELQGLLTDATNQKDTSEANKQRLEGELKHLRELFAQLSGDLDRAQKSIESMTSTINSNRTLIDQLQTANNELRENLRGSQGDRDAAVQQVNALEIQLKRETDKTVKLEADLADLMEARNRLQFELNWFKERFPGASAQVQPPHTGLVLAADPKLNVFVISLGEEDGVKPGFQYTVSRGSEYVGTIQISDVQAKQSSGFALRGLSKTAIQRQDVVSSSK